MKLVVFVVILSVSAALAERRRYEGYSVVEVKPSTREQNEALISLMNSRPEWDFWLEPTARMTPVHIMSARHNFQALKSTVKRLGLIPEIVVDNVQALVEADAASMNDDKYDYNYTQWNTYESMLAEIREMADDCPEGFTCSVETIGQSVEGRNIDVLVINTGMNTGKSFWVDSLIHAREWLAGATTMNIFDRLIRSYGDDDEVTSIVDRFENIYYLPVMNPDGYQYSWDSDRLWRKNRRLPVNNCYGVDLNRNYEFRWGMDGGSSPLECSETFRGPSAASEPETQAVQNYVSSLDETFEVFLTFHTYGYYWLVPFGNCSDPENGPATLQVANDTARAIELENDTTWLDGNSCRVLYATDGSSADWAQGMTRSSYVYTPELRGPFFTPGEGAIDPSVREIWAGLVEMFDSIDHQ